MERETPDHCKIIISPNEQILLSIYRDPSGWLWSLKPADQDEVISFLFGETRAIPRCLSELGFKRRIIASPVRHQPMIFARA